MTSSELVSRAAPGEKVGAVGFARRRFARLGAAIVVYALALVLCAHGVLAHPGSRVFTGFNDATSTIRDYWAASAQHHTPFDLTNDALQGAPQGSLRVPATQLANGAIQAGFVWELRGVLGLVGAWNAFMLLGLFATGIAMFAFLESLGCNLLASLLGGYVFAFGPYALERAYGGHLALLHNWVFPLLAWLLLRLRDRRSLSDALAVGATVALAFYLSSYQGLFAAFMTLVFVAIDLVGHGSPGRLGVIGRAAAAYGTAAVAVSPILVLYARERSEVALTTSRTSSDFYAFAATFSAYALPSPRNPLFHWTARSHGLLTEETLYVGWVTMVLAAVSIVMVWRRRRATGAGRERAWTAISLVVLAAAAFAMSLPPSYRLGPLSLPMPSKLLGLTTSFWRVYSRFGVVVGFALISLAMLALTALSARLGSRGRPLVLLLAAAVLVEILPGNARTFDTTSEPAWVAFLAREPRGTLAVYPSYFGSDLAQAAWYQVLDRDPLFQVFEDTPVQTEKLSRDNAIRLLARDVWRPLTAEVLATEGVRYVLVDEGAYASAGEGFQRPVARQYALLARFGPIRIYAVHAGRTSISRALATQASLIAGLEGFSSSLTYGAGFYPSEPFEGLTSRWMSQDGQVELGLDAPGAVTLSWTAFANQSPRALELRDRTGHVLGRVTVPTSATGVRFGPITLRAGVTTLTLSSTPGPQQLGPQDPRSASVFLEPVTLVATPTFAGATRGP